VQLTAFDNAYAERWVRSVEEECLSKAILFGERSLRLALSEYVEHYHAERRGDQEIERPLKTFKTRCPNSRAR
jgi:hypothetical protein